MMQKFKVSVQIGFYSKPYKYWIVEANNKQDACTKINSMLPKYYSHRFLNVELYK